MSKMNLQAVGQTDQRAYLEQFTDIMYVVLISNTGASSISLNNYITTTYCTGSALCFCRERLLSSTPPDDLWLPPVSS